MDLMDLIARYGRAKAKLRREGRVLTRWTNTPMALKIKRNRARNVVEKASRKLNQKRARGLA